MVLMPNNPRAGGISERIDGEERDELRAALIHRDSQGDEVIIRTAVLEEAQKSSNGTSIFFCNYGMQSKKQRIKNPRHVDLSGKQRCSSSHQDNLDTILASY